MFATLILFFLVVTSASFGWHLVTESLEVFLSSFSWGFLASLGTLFSWLITLGDLAAFFFFIYKILISTQEMLLKFQSYRFKDWLVFAVIWPFYGLMLLNYLVNRFKRSRT